MTTENTVPFHDGPHLLCAVLCEKVLQEVDGVKTAVRMIDRIRHSVVQAEGASTEMAPFEFQMFLLIRFKSGSARGSMELQLRIQKPSGESTVPPPMNINLEGDDDRGVDIVAPMNIRLEFTGLYWFDLELNGIRITRMPLRVFYNPIRLPEGPGSASSEQPPSL